MDVTESTVRAIRTTRHVSLLSKPEWKNFINFFMRRFAFYFPIILLIVGCTKLEINDQTYQFNEAAGNVGNQLLLLNAVRSAKGYPTKFSRTNEYFGHGRVSGKIRANLPFVIDSKLGAVAMEKIRFRKQNYLVPEGNFNAGIASIDPEINFNTGVEKLSMYELDTREAQALLKSTISRNQFFYYEEQGWNIFLLSMLTIEEIEITLSFFRELNYSTPSECLEITDCSNKLDLSECNTEEFSPYNVRGIDFIRFKNNPRNKCSYAAFRKVVELIIDSGFTIENHINKKENFDEMSVNFNDSHIQSRFNYELSRRDSKGYGVDPIEFRLRSPERIVRYLGDLIAAQSLEQDQYVPQIRIDINGSHEYVDFLKIVKNAGYDQRWAVSVKDPEGERFAIPIPDYSSPIRHRSLQTLALAMDIYNSAVSGTIVPTSSTILLRPG